MKNKAKLKITVTRAIDLVGAVQAMRPAIATSLNVEAQSVVASKPPSRTFGYYNNYQVPCRVLSCMLSVRMAQGEREKKNGLTTAGSRLYLFKIIEYVQLGKRTSTGHENNLFY